MFVFYRKQKIRNVVVLDVRSAVHLEAFFACFFLHVSNVLGVYRGVRVRSHVSYAEAWIVISVAKSICPLIYMYNFCGGKFCLTPIPRKLMSAAGC